jgi:arsenite methyltransferase
MEWIMNDLGDKNKEAVRKLDYGVDAPGLVRFFLRAGTVVAALFFATHFLLGYSSVWRLLVVLFLGIAAIYLIGMGSLMLFWSKVTKVRQRERTLDLILWRGNERVLDVGCGRGLMLIGAALRLTTGRATGIDIWDAKDQSANSPQGTSDNAGKAGVLDKIEIRTGDMRKLPFEDRSFDVVVSHWVVHNLADEADRNLALSEMVRVLCSGGQLILCDIEHRDAYVAKLKVLGLQECRVLFQPIADILLGAISFGSFRPTTIIGCKVA